MKSIKLYILLGFALVLLGFVCFVLYLTIVDVVNYKLDIDYCREIYPSKIEPPFFGETYAADATLKPSYIKCCRGYWEGVELQTECEIFKRSEK